VTRTAALLGLILLCACGGDDPAPNPAPTAAERTFTAPSDVMAPSIRKGDTVACTAGPPERVERGDVVLFEADISEWPAESGSTSHLRRVVGLPGEAVYGDKLGVFVNGARLAEPYIAHGRDTLPDFIESTVKPGEYLVLGDTRSPVEDSRVYGNVAHAKLLGTCTSIVAPDERKGPIPGT
jgi:signal peptidase I